MCKNYLLFNLLITPFITCSLIFKIGSGEERCVIEEFYQGSVFVVKHKLFTLKKQDISSIFPFARLIIKELEPMRQIINEHINTPKGKSTYTASKGGLYKICIALIKSHIIEGLKDDIYGSLKLSSENMDDIDFSNAIKSEDVDHAQKKAKEILSISKPIIQFQDEQLDIENKSSMETIKNTKWYKYLTFIQLTLSIIIGLVQVNNFRKFLKSQNVI